MSKEKNPKQNNDEQVLESRRRTVRNILSGIGATAVGSQSSNWVTPAVDSIVLPSHANTTGLPLVGAIASDQTTNVLDFFIQSGFAEVSPLVGGCLSLTIVNSIIDGEITFNNGDKENGTGVIGQGTIDGQPADANEFAFDIGKVSIVGTVDNPDAPTSASGTADKLPFTTIVGAQCSVIAPPTTTACVPNGTPCPGE